MTSKTRAFAPRFREEKNKEDGGVLALPIKLTWNPPEPPVGKQVCLKTWIDLLFWLLMANPKVGLKQPKSQANALSRVRTLGFGLGCLRGTYAPRLRLYLLRRYVDPFSASFTLPKPCSKAEGPSRIGRLDYHIFSPSPPAPTPPSGTNTLVR